MALPTSGAISLQQIGDEANSTTSSTNAVSLNDTNIRGLVSKLSGDENSFDDYYGVSSSAIISGDGFYFYLTMAGSNINPGQPDPQQSYLWIVVKLGGNIVKGSLTNNSNVYAFGGSISYVTTAANNASYTHTDGNTYVPTFEWDANNTPTNNYPSLSFPNQLSMYDNFGIKLEGT